MRYLIVFLLCLSLLSSAELDEAISKTRSDILKTRQELDTQSETITKERITIQQELSKLQAEIKELKATRGALDLERIKAKDARLKQESELEYITKTLSFMDNSILEFRRTFETRMSSEQRQHYADSFTAVDTALHSRDSSKALSTLLKLASEHCDDQLGGQKLAVSVIDSNNVKREGYSVQLGPIQYFSSADNQGILVQEKNVVEPRLYDNFDEIEKTGIKALVNDGSGLVPIDITRGTAVKLREIDESFMDKIAKGGLTMYPLVALAIFCLIVAIYKLISINLYKVSNTEKRIASVLAALEDNNEESALSQCDKMGLPLGPVIKVGIKHRNATREHIEELMYERVLVMLPKLEKLLTPLAVGASAAPLLGLLGTVTGMIHTFSLIQVYGTGDASVLSSGIAEALITTLVGLMIAVPALLMHAYLSGRVKKAVSATQQSAIMFVNGLTIQKKEQDA